jgi:hypothetical protein
MFGKRRKETPKPVDPREAIFDADVLSGDYFYVPLRYLKDDERGVEGLAYQDKEGDIFFLMRAKDSSLRMTADWIKRNTGIITVER